MKNGTIEQQSAVSQPTLQIVDRPINDHEQHFINAAVNRAERNLDRALEENRSERILSALIERMPPLQPRDLYVRDPNFINSMINALRENERRERTTAPEPLHIIGDLYFKIQKRATQNAFGETYTLCTVINGQEQHAIDLCANQIELIMRHIGDIRQLKNIFNTDFQSETATEILHCIENAELRAEQRSPPRP